MEVCRPDPAAGCPPAGMGRGQRLSRQLSSERVYKSGSGPHGGEGHRAERECRRQGWRGPGHTMETLGQTRELEHCLRV